VITPKLIDCFESMISEQQADFLLRAGVKKYTYDELRTIAGLAETEFGSFFNEILRKGLMVAWWDEFGNRTYDLGAIVVGWFEWALFDGKVDEQKIAFTKNLDAYISGFRYVSASPLKPIINAYFSTLTPPTFRVLGMKLKDEASSTETIPVNVSVPVGSQHIHPGDAILDYLQKGAGSEAIALVHCFCRQWRQIMEQPCRFGHDPESCIVLGHIARQAIETGIGRAITLEEAVSVVEKTRKRGAVHTIFHDRDELDQQETIICNCCWDCCGFLGTYNRGFHGYQCRSHHQTVRVRPEECIYCKKCVRFCPAGAIESPNDDTITVSLQRCIGCGQCAFQCPQQVYDLEHNDRNVYLPALKQEDARIR
jgi:Pyruvate/2-oxoacid:ferredoxin oxidoreductase delta subunit